jgi:ATP-dependent Clp protease ATP-binding subunit ClpC
LHGIQKNWKKGNQTAGLVNEEVIAEVVSKMTGVPLTRLEKEEVQRLLEM